MGVLAWLRGDDLGRASVGVLTGRGGDVAQVRHLPDSVAAAFGLSAPGTVDRESAMRIPSVRRARQVICGTIGGLQLIAHATRSGAVLDVTSERPLLAQPDPSTTLQFTLTWTVDDLFFRGVSWWRVLSRDADDYPATAERLAPHRVIVDLGEGVVRVDGQVAADRDLIRFDGPDEGVLTYGSDVLATARLLEQGTRRNIDGLPPLDLLTLEEGAPELDTTPGSGNPDDPKDLRSEVDLILDEWASARQRRSTAFLNRAVKHTAVGYDPAALGLAEVRREQRAEIANLCNVAPRYVNAPSATSMTYSNVTAERADLVDTSLSGFLVAIEQRLSLGDVTPRGTAVRFDLSRYLQGDPTTALANAKTAVELGAMDKSEVRTDVLGRTPLPTGGTDA